MKEKNELTPEAIELKRQYYKTWRAANPDKVKANMNRYWNRKAEQLKQDPAKQ